MSCPAPAVTLSREVERTGARLYRDFDTTCEGRVPFQVTVATTDLYLRADRDLSALAREAARRARAEIEAAIRARPAFATALQPLADDGDTPSALVRGMLTAGQRAGVGPMAAVAGAVAEAVGCALRRESQEVIVENGGDLYLDLTRDAVVGLYAGDSAFSGRLGLRVAAAHTPLAICTSSGQVGPSLSYGCCDAAVAIGMPAAVADATATAIGNRIQRPEDLEAAVEWALGVPGIDGALAIAGDHMAAVGRVELVPLRPAAATAQTLR